MGLNIGVTVKQQQEGYMSYGYNPKGTMAEVDEAFDDFLRRKFPDSAFNPQAILIEADQKYEFDVRLPYDWGGYNSTSMYLAILEFVLHNFSAGYGIDLHIYHSP